MAELSSEINLTEKMVRGGFQQRLWSPKETKGVVCTEVAISGIKSRCKICVKSGWS